MKILPWSSLVVLCASSPVRAELDFDQPDCGDNASTTFCAANCTVSEVEASISNAVSASPADVKLYLPACDEAIASTIDAALVDNMRFEIIGQGNSATVFRHSTGRTATLFRFSFPQGCGEVNTSYFSFHDIGLQGNQESGVSTGIYLYGADDFRIHGNHLYDSRWSGPFLFKGCGRGLIDNNTILSTAKTSDNKGIYLGGNWVDHPEACSYNPDSHSCGANACDEHMTAEMGSPGCDDPATEWCADCSQTWMDWFNDPTTNNCFVWDNEWIAGSGDAIYIENNDLHFSGPAFNSDWGSRTQVVFRYNDVTQYTGGNSTPLKPGLVWVEIYRNNFFTTPSVTRYDLGTYRCDVLTYDNRWFNAGALGSNDLNAYYCFNGFCYPDGVLFDEIYLWGNLTYSEYDDSGALTEEDARCGDLNSRDCFRVAAEGSDADKARIRDDIDDRLFHRAPTLGDRIYSGHSDSPVHHFDCPHPAIGLTGHCSDSAFGLVGYDVGGVPHDGGPTSEDGGDGGPIGEDGGNSGPTGEDGGDSGGGDGVSPLGDRQDGVVGTGCQCAATPGVPTVTLFWLWMGVWRRFARRPRGRRATPRR